MGGGDGREGGEEVGRRGKKGYLLVSTNFEDPSAGIE